VTIADGGTRNRTDLSWLIDKILGMPTSWDCSAEITHVLAHYGATKKTLQLVVKIMNAFFHCHYLQPFRWKFLEELAKDHAALASFYHIFADVEPICSALTVLTTVQAQKTDGTFMANRIDHSDAQFKRFTEKSEIISGIPETATIYVTILTLYFYNWNKNKEGSTASMDKIKEDYALCTSAADAVEERLNAVNVEGSTVFRIPKTNSLSCPKYLLERLAHKDACFPSYLHNGKKEHFAAYPGESSHVPVAFVESNRTEGKNATFITTLRSFLISC